MFHIVYLTTNLVNNKIYVGKHSTWNLNDGYLGSGRNLLKAIEKYGKDFFDFKILHYCLDSKQANEIESLIVDKWFIKRSDTYNIALGGSGGDTFTGMSEEQKIKFKNTSNFFLANKPGKIISENAKQKMKQNHADVKGNKNPRARKVLCIFPNGNELILHGNYLTFIKELGFNHQTIRPLIDTGKINKPILPNHSIKTKEMIMKLNGFEFQYI